MDGILNIYKEQGYTSFDVVARLRSILKQKKIGHTGTLDPMAEGVLPVCLGRATKLVDILTSKDKEYEAVMRLGYETDTEDITGKIITEESRIKDVGLLKKSLTEDYIIETVNRYVGDYMQLPPMYSAIKKAGKKLYEYAREGIAVEREARPVSIYSIDNISVNLPDVSFNVHCSKGTYIRSLCRDIGRSLGTGATLASLKRSRVNIYTLDNSLTLERVEKLREEGCLEKYITPMDAMLSMYNRLDVTQNGIKYIRNGNKLYSDMVTGAAAADNEIFRVYLDNNFIALYQYNESEAIYKPYKMFL